MGQESFHAALENEFEKQLEKHLIFQKPHDVQLAADLVLTLFDQSLVSLKLRTSGLTNSSAQARKQSVLARMHCAVFFIFLRLLNGC